jgi:hypothetical protein
MVHRGSGFSEGTRKVQDRIRNERPDPDHIGPERHRPVRPRLPMTISDAAG